MTASANESPKSTHLSRRRIVIAVIGLLLVAAAWPIVHDYSNVRRIEQLCALFNAEGIEYWCLPEPIFPQWSWKYIAMAFPSHPAGPIRLGSVYYIAVKSRDELETITRHVEPGDISYLCINCINKDVTTVHAVEGRVFVAAKRFDPHRVEELVNFIAPDLVYIAGSRDGCGARFEPPFKLSEQMLSILTEPTQ